METNSHPLKHKKLGFEFTLFHPFSMETNSHCFPHYKPGFQFTLLHPGSWKQIHRIAILTIPFLRKARISVPTPPQTQKKLNSMEKKCTFFKNILDFALHNLHVKFWCLIGNERWKRYKFMFVIETPSNDIFPVELLFSRLFPCLESNTPRHPFVKAN